MDKRKFLGTIVGAVFFIVCLLFVTYAWYNWRSSDTDVDITISDTSRNFIQGRLISGEKLGPVLDYLNEEYYTVENQGIFVSYDEFSIENPASDDWYITIKLDITSISEALLVDSFKYSLVKQDSNGDYTDVVCEGNFADFSIGENLACHNIILPGIGEQEIESVVTYFRFVVYIDGSMYNSNDMMNGSFEAIININDYSDYTLDTSGANAPYIGSNTDTTLIPVYYDQASGNWKKADKSNANENYKWYNYDEQMWANAVLVSSTNRNVYKGATLGTTISMSDILAFYVWIPRYKYRVWNISRQPYNDNEFSYSLDFGVDVEFEINRKSTGNVECTYDTSVSESDANLSDTCIYNGTDTITTSSVNSNYTDAWYTHPAFNFGTSSKYGIWVGKFKVGGTSSSPVMKPDVQALTNQAISEQFTTSKVFQTYGLSSRLEAHMMTNLEWGAVAYFAYSNYGVCDSLGCGNVYFNNSSSYYTGRSYGDVFDDEVNTTSGTYSYDGYVMTDDTVKSTTKDITKIASTTGNIYGVYDMSSVSGENVMANVLSSTYEFSVGNAGVNWNGNNTLNSKYYNIYSYGINGRNIAFYRTMLGDATGELIKQNLGNNGMHFNDFNGNFSAAFPTASYPWYTRGNCSSFSLFCFGATKGGAGAMPFRSVLS